MTEGGETLTIQVVIQAVAQRRRAGMENRREEFLKTVCQIYMAAVLVVLPLYYIPGNGYDKLGDSKYYLYRNISLICIGICLVVQIIVVVKSYLMEKHRRIEQRCRMENCASVGMYIGMYIRKNGKKMIVWCREHIVVTAVCLYGACAVVSALCSPYGSTAWTGEKEWYMGAVMICLMIGIVRKPAYLLVLLLRGAFCAMIVYGISIVCMRKGITAPVNLNILSIGTGALLGLPGIIALYAAAVFLLQ